MKLNVIILAGGQSTRFWPLEEKNLFEFFGTPLVAYQIRRYSVFFKRMNFVPHFVVVTNEANHNLIKAKLEKNNFKDITLITQTLPDQSGAVIAALKKLPKNEPILVVNSNDIFSETLINDLLKRVKESKLILTARQVKSYFPGGYLVRDNSGRIERIVEKPQSNTVPAQYNLFKFVFDYFAKKESLESIFDQYSAKNLSYEDALNLLLKNEEADLILNDQPFTSLKYPWHILEATSIFLNTIKESIVKTQDIDSTAQIVGKVFLSEGVKIGAFTKIVGPVFIGKNTVVGDHVLIRDSHIGQNCLIGAHTEVARSYIGNQVLLHRNYIGDSVLSDESSFGANAVTANWRFDQGIIKSTVRDERIETSLDKLGAIVGSQAKIGVSVSLMPGVKINKKSQLNPGQVIFKDVHGS